MSFSYTTLAQHLVINNESAVDLNVSDLILSGTMLGLLHAVPSSNGTKHEYYKETAAPTVGFRSIGAAAGNAPGVQTPVTTELKLLDATVLEDQAKADNDRRGVSGFLAWRALQNLKKAFHVADKQFMYGTLTGAAAGGASTAAEEGSSDGFVGLAEADVYNELTDDRVIDAGGSGQVQSIWVIRTGEDDLASVYNGQAENGDGGEDTLVIGEFFETMANSYNGAAGAVDGQFPAYGQPISAFIGLQLGGALSAVRIVNVDVTSVNIEARISEAIEMFPEDRPATNVLMSRKSRLGIKNGRTTYHPAGMKAPKPEDVDGVPINIVEALTWENEVV